MTRLVNAVDKRPQEKTTGGLGNLRQATVHYNSYQLDDDVVIFRGTHSIHRVCLRADLG
jgi:hypothetical protein